VEIPGQPFLPQGDQFFVGKGLGNIVVHPSFQAAFPIPRHGAGRHDKDGNFSITVGGYQIADLALCIEIDKNLPFRELTIRKGVLYVKKILLHCIELSDNGARNRNLSGAGDDRGGIEERDERRPDHSGGGQLLHHAHQGADGHALHGIRTPMGIKVLGPNLDQLEKIGKRAGERREGRPRHRSAYAERVTTGYFLDINIRREEIARYGLNVDDMQEIIQAALGGMTQTITVEGRERYPLVIMIAMLGLS